MNSIMLIVYLIEYDNTLVIALAKACRHTFNLLMESCKKMYVQVWHCRPRAGTASQPRAIYPCHVPEYLIET